MARRCSPRLGLAVGSLPVLALASTLTAGCRAGPTTGNYVRVPLVRLLREHSSHANTHPRGAPGTPTPAEKNHRRSVANGPFTARRRRGRRGSLARHRATSARARRASQTGPWTPTLPQPHRRSLQAAYRWKPHATARPSLEAERLQSVRACSGGALCRHRRLAERVVRRPRCWR